MIDDLINDDAANGQVGRVDPQRVQHGSDRPRLAALLDRVSVDYYGQQTPLKQLATINVPEPRLLTVQPFDPSSIKSIERSNRISGSPPRTTAS